MADRETERYGCMIQVKISHTHIRYDIHKIHFMHETHVNHKHTLTKHVNLYLEKCKNYYEK